MDIFDKLPYDLQIKVYNFIRFPQSKELLYDIKNYFNMKKLIYDKYLSRGLMYSDYYFDDLNIHAWIDYELIIFKNDKKNIYNDDCKKLNHFLSYKIISKRKNDNDKTIYTFRNNLNLSCIYRINRKLSFLTIQERLDFLNN